MQTALRHCEDYACTPEHWRLSAERRIRAAVLARALRMPPPGVPDETWRRVPAASFETGSLSPEGFDCIGCGAEYGESGSPVRDSGEQRSNPARAVMIGPETEDSRSVRRYEEFTEAFESAVKKKEGSRIERPNNVWENRLSALNRALSPNVIWIEIPPDSEGALDLSIRLKNGPAETALPFLCIDAGAGSRCVLTLHLEHGGGKGGPCIAGMQILGRAGSRLKFLSMQNGTAAASGFMRETAVLLEDALLERDLVSAGGAPSVCEQRFLLTGRAAAVTVRGVSVIGKQEQSYNRVSAEHYAPHTRSVIEMKSLAAEGGYGYFNGVIMMPRGCTRSEGHERYHSLLLDAASRAEALPQLEVVENDVECSHASVMDSLRPEDIYYLGSRGLDAEKARELLLSSFLRSSLKRMPSAADSRERYMRIRAFIERTGGIRIDEPDWTGEGDERRHD